MKKEILCLFLLCIVIFSVRAQENGNHNKFRQLTDQFATPNSYRTASGAPGPDYWQQRADYKIAVSLDDSLHQIHGAETITYTNNSPDRLDYLWMQLDQNVRALNSDTYLTATSRLGQRVSLQQIENLDHFFDGGFKIVGLKDEHGNALSHTVVKTMMRVDLPTPLLPGQKFSFSVKWWYTINDHVKDNGRSGYEYFKEDGNYLYTIAQFYPRMAVYNDYEGWQHKQFLGRGEFTLPFGDFEVKITVPADHIVAATGELQNKKQVLTPTELQRLKRAATSGSPVEIITEDEALKNESHRTSQTKTWIYKAKNVRDFAFASSRKFIWDAMGVQFGKRTVMAMSFYPKEGNPLWKHYATKLIAFGLKSYSAYTFPYPYPVAIAVHTADIGMEYPMICFDDGRPEADGTYPLSEKDELISVIIHEVGHNFFPMIVNSDERQWSWMDEGVNQFLEFLTEQSWEKDYPSFGGLPYQITDYMKGDKSTMTPIMSNSDDIQHFGYNVYAKTATALNILRETILGRKLFDYAFKEYARRWKFKHPTPEDFFRTMEDASGVDLDWFWRGWFYTTNDVDLSMDKVTWYQASTLNPSVERPIQKKEHQRLTSQSISDIRNSKVIGQTAVRRDSTLRDFYSDYDPYAVTDQDTAAYRKKLSRFSDAEKNLLTNGRNYYQIDFSNIGGLVMPIILQFSFTDGTSTVIRIPAEIWRLNNDHVSKVFAFDKQLKSIVMDPFYETADVDRSNNYWPRRMVPHRFELFKYEQDKSLNPMEKALQKK